MKKNHLYYLLSSFQHICKLVFMLVTATFLTITLSGINRSYASCLDISDVPLDAQFQSAPGIIMFIIDDSGSMDWEFMCQSESNGLFSGYYYIFANPGDNAYSGNILEGSSRANKWKAQWAGYNRLYYNPSSTYTPWPTYTDADPTNPRSNPSVSGNTLNLSATYHDFGVGSGISDQAILDAGGVIVDNTDLNTNSDIIVDNKDASPYYTQNGSWQESSASNEYANSSYYTSNSGSYATWAPNIPTAGTYKVLIHYTTSGSRDSNAKYTVHHSGGDTIFRINQTIAPTSSTDFKELGNFYFNTGTSGYVRVTRDNLSTGTSTSADAVKFVPQFTSTQPKFFEFGTGWATSDNTSGYYGSNYLYSLDPWAAKTATWTANNLNVTQTYNVYAKWAGNSSRLSSVTYKTYNSGVEVASQSINQQTNNAGWVLIAEEVTFSSGTGVVKIDQNGANSDLCADAVAFMPAVDFEPLNLVRAHYYVVSGGNTYLVNLNGNFKYYRVDDQDADETVDSPDELVELTQPEAQAAGIVTGRTYAEERQNFANWYSFYRKRELTAKNAISHVITEMDGVYIGLHTINGGLKSIAKPVKVTLNTILYDQSSELLTSLFSINSSGGTPLRNGLKNIGRYFEGLYGKPSPLPSTEFFGSDTYPFFKADYGGSCQQSFAILMTDGFWNGTNPSVNNADRDDDGVQVDGFDGAPYADNASDTLADVAMKYYETDLNTSLTNDVPVNSTDMANHQHLVTYSLSFGLEGTLDRDSYLNCPPTCPTWPTPSADAQTTIDDLWHASVNGRGKYVDAATPEEMLEAMNKLKQDIESRLGSAASLATNSIQRQVGTYIYQGTYNTAGWFGEISAVDLNQDTGAVDDSVWKASDHVPAWSARNILSYNGSEGIPFRSDYISVAQKSLLGTDWLRIVNFIRGNEEYSGFRKRTGHPIGDIVHSAPLYYKGVVYIGANDGMLHAVDAATGEEKFCYVPGFVYDHLAELASPSYSHKYYVDGSPVAANINGKDILVCGLGKGGKGYFALDITDPDSMTDENASDKVLWEFPSGIDNDMGYSFSSVTITKTKAKDYVVVFGNGYNSTNEKAVLYILDNPDTNSPIPIKIDTLVNGCNGLSSPLLVDVDNDLYADYAFAGDLKGNMWKFDLRDAAGNWTVYYNSGSDPQPLISVRNASGTVQPITSAPEVMLDCPDTPFANSGVGLMVIFGTGQYLNTSDFSNNSTQSVYGIWDWGDIWEANSCSDDKKKYLGTFMPDRSVSNLTDKTLQQQTMVASSGIWSVLSDNPVDWVDFTDYPSQTCQNISSSTGDDMGWFFDLPTPGERIIQNPIIRMDVVQVVSTIPPTSICKAGGNSVFYQLNSCTGGRTYEPKFDVDGDGKINRDDKISVPSPLPPTLPPTGEKFDNIVFNPIVIGDIRYFVDSSGNIVTRTETSYASGLFFWRVLQ